MARVEPTRKDALRFWWALAWRFGACMAIIWLTLGLCLGLLSAAAQWPPERIDTAGSVLSLLVGAPLSFLASWECLYRVIGLKIDGKELVLWSRDP